MNYSIISIRVLHILFIIYILIGLFIGNDKMYIILYITTIISLKIHWYANDDTCALTIIEQIITNKYKDETFVHRIISPIYKIENDKLNILSKIITDIYLIMAIVKLTL